MVSRTRPRDVDAEIFWHRRLFAASHYNPPRPPLGMDTPQLPRRKAAIKATTQLADLSSSDEDNNADNENDNYGARAKQKTRRVKGGELTENTKEGKTHSKRGSVVGSVNIGATTGSGRKRKRAASTLTGGPQKRQRGNTNTRCKNSDTVRGGSNGASDLTSLSSDAETKSSVNPTAEFPFKLTPPPSSPNRQKLSRAKLKQIPSPKILDLADDSDELPDVGLVLSQQDVSPSKGTSYQKRGISAYSNTQAKHTRNNTLSSLMSSSTPPPPSIRKTPSLSSLSRGSPTCDGTTTEPNTSDHYDFQAFSDESDLELDSVGVGELCLAKSKATGTVYWPARILQVKKSTGKPTGKQKKTFRIMFLDKKEKDIPRNWFYTSSQEEFCTCSVSESTVPFYSGYR